MRLRITVYGERRGGMGEEKSVILHGVWVSPIVRRVELALKAKGISFVYVEEDLNNKSPSLLSYNPVYKKVPLLVHNGKPISESSVILEYIDEVWKNGPRLLPEDPYKRAQIRFWADFIHQQLFESVISALKTDGEAQEKSIKELKEKLKVFEDCLKDLFPEGSRFVNDDLGLLDIVMSSVFGSYEILEEVAGIKFMEEERIPGIFSWLTGLREHPIVKKVSPPKEKFVGYLRCLRQNAVQSSAV